MDGRRSYLGSSGCGNNLVVLHMEALKEELKVKLKTRNTLYKILDVMDVITFPIGVVICCLVYPVLLAFSFGGENKALVWGSLACGIIGSAIIYVAGSLNDDFNLKFTALVTMGVEIGLSVAFLFA